MEFDLTKNFNQIFVTICNKGIKRTAFAKAIGYSSTSQLDATLKGKAMISTKAIIELIKNFNINPTYLFTGQGDIFLNDESEIENLKKQNLTLMKDYDAELKKVKELNEIIKIMNDRYGELIDLTTSAIKYHKIHKNDVSEVEDKDSSLSTK